MFIFVNVTWCKTNASYIMGATDPLVPSPARQTYFGSWDAL